MRITHFSRQEELSDQFVAKQTTKKSDLAEELCCIGRDLEVRALVIAKLT